MQVIRPRNIESIDQTSKVEVKTYVVNLVYSNNYLARVMFIALVFKTPLPNRMVKVDDILLKSYVWLG